MDTYDEELYHRRINECLTEAKKLIGKTIVDIRYPAKEIQQKFDWWTKFPLVLILDDGTHLVPQIDDEGTDTGALLVMNMHLDPIEVFPSLPSYN